MKVQSLVNSLLQGNFGHADLHISVAEAAFATGNQNIARNILERYFQTDPQKNQLYCRGRILMGLIIDYEATVAIATGAESLKQRKYALNQIMIALDVAIATENISRYKFLVFNISISCWHIVNKFLRATRASQFVQEMSRMTNALETVDDPDKTWRIMYLSACAVCYDDNKDSKSASEMIDKALEHAEFLLSSTNIIETNLSEEIKAAKTETEDIMSAVRRYEERESAKNKPKKIDPDVEGGEEIEEEVVDETVLEGLDALSYNDLKAMLDKAQIKKSLSDEKLQASNIIKKPQEERIRRLYMQRVHVNPVDSKRLLTLPAVAQSIRARVLVQLQCMLSGCIPDKEWEATFNSLVTDLTASTDFAKVETLLDVSRTAWNLNMRDIAIKCEDMAAVSTAVSPNIRVKIDICKALRIVSDITEESANQILSQRLSALQIEGYSVSRRIEAIKLLERIITMCVSRLDDSALLQEICIIIWNTALPLMQPHLRLNIHNALQQAATSLINISSPLMLLRSQLHFEISKCEEQSDFVIKSCSESDESLALDYGTMEARPDGTVDGEDLNRNRVMDHLIKPFSEVLHLRSNVYDTPSDCEGQALLMLQQIKESNSKQFQKDMLQKIASGMIEEITVLENPPDVKNLNSEVSLNRRAIFIPEINHSEIILVLELDRSSGKELFTDLNLKRILIMCAVAKIAQDQRNLPILQHAARYVLSSVWDKSDPFFTNLIEKQVEMHFLLADSFVEQLAKLKISDDKKQEMIRDEEDLLEKNGFLMVGLDVNEDGPLIQSPLALGLISKYASDEINDLKKYIVLCISKGLQLSHLINDQYGVQNAIIYFWNLHIHIFRKKLYSQSTDEIFEFVRICCDAIESFVVANNTSDKLDERLRISLFEALSVFYEINDESTKAVEIAMKGCVGGSSFERKRICEHTSRLISKNPVPVGKGGAGDGNFNDPFLNVFSALTQAELLSIETSKDQVISLVGKAENSMNNEVDTLLKSMNWEDMAQEIYNQYMEMQAESWTRLTRLKISLGDIHGSQSTAERCMSLVAEGLLRESDEKKLSSRVWRWVSVCERYFGMAIAMIIQPEGQDAALQYELRLAALRHFTISCKYALRSEKETLIITAAINAWNVSIPLIDVSATRKSLSVLFRQIIDSLLTCNKKNAMAASLKQQMYLSLIDGCSQDRNWDEAQNIVFEAFDHVPIVLQKPLWKWRVVVLSKKGKNVLDGIQKLKEGNISLQARVYGILARASSNPKQQLDAYKKTIEILSEDLERVDYMLETSQWMSSSGVPRHNINDMVLAALDSLYEVEHKSLSTDDPSLTSDDTKSSSSFNTMASNKRPNSKTGTKLASSGSRRMSLSSIVGEGSGTGNAKLNAKQLELAVRSIAMLAMLSNDESSRRKRCIESLYFIQKYIQNWSILMLQSHKSMSYLNLSQSERDEHPYDTFVVESVPDGLKVPSDPIDLLSWNPNSDFLNIMTTVTTEVPLNVPSDVSLGSLPLTLHYTLWLSNCLDRFGYSKHALLCLGWLRSLLIFLPGKIGREAAFAAVYYKSINIMRKISLVKESEKLPTVLGNTDITCSEYLSQIVAQVITLDSSVVKIPETMSSEKLNIFGFSTFTQSLDEIDSLSCGLEICKDLLELGQLSLCHSLALTLRVDFSLRKNIRGILSTSSILASLELSKGRYKEALALLLSNSLDDLSLVGDAEMLAANTILTMKCYVLSGNSEEAKQVAIEAIAIIAQFSNLVLNTPSKTAPNNSQSRMNTAQTMMTDSSKRGSLRSQSTLRPSNLSNTECSYENCNALTTVAMEYADLLCREAIIQMKEWSDPRSTFYEVITKLTQLTSSVSSVVGPSSSLCALLLSKQSTSIFSLLTQLHAISSGQIPISSYLRWLEDNYELAIDLMEQAVDIRRGLLSCLSLADLTYFPQLTLLPKVDPAAVPAKKGTAVTPVEVEQPKPRQLVLSPLLFLGRDEVALASQYIALTVLRGDHSATRQAKEDTTIEINAADKYLETTKSEVDFKLSDFKTPLIFKSIQLAASAIKNCEGCGYGIESNNYFSTSDIMRMAGSGIFDEVWSREIITDSENPDENPVVPVSSISIDAENARSILEVKTTNSIMNRKFEAASIGACTLVDTFGFANVNQSVCWLLHLQSIASREWLLNIWRDSLIPTSETACSLGRLENLEKQLTPTYASKLQIDVELSFLNSSNSSWRRLDVSSNPATILSKLPTSIVVLSIQFCPRLKTLYACAGVPSQTSVNADNFTAGGSWTVDKIDLSEDSRRILQTLKKEHALWREDLTKFISTFGENIAYDEDLEGIESKFSDKRLKKTEAALEERFRALLLDLESIMLPILGQGSEIDSFIGSKICESTSELSLLFFIDPLLQNLPWEGLEMVSTKFNGRVARDFSIHMTGHRLNTLLAPEVGGKAVADPNQLVPISSMSVKTFIDPFGDELGNTTEGYERESITEIVENIKNNVALGGSKWGTIGLNVKGSQSQQDWIEALQQSTKEKPSTWIVYGPGRFGSQFFPKDMASCLSLEKVAFIFCSDLGYNDSSIRRQNSSDNQRQPQEIVSELPLSLAASASLSGVGAMVINVWSTSFAAQKR
jgi:hypothetical protein